MQQLILMLHVLVSVGLVVLILIQHGKGADVGAAFGSGSANTMFGSAGSTPFLVKVTATFAAIFFCTSLGLSYLVARGVKHVDPLTQITQPVQQSDVPVKQAAPKTSPKKTQTPK